MKKEQRRVKKLNNRGFSLVEIIIVIAIMAILAGVLAPQLIKYIDKSRKSADVQTAQTIASAVNTALADEDAYNVAASTLVSDCTPGAADVFKLAVGNIIGSTSPVPKYRTSNYKNFAIYISTTDKSFAIYAVSGSYAISGTPDTKDMLYPTVGSNFK